MSLLDRHLDGDSVKPSTLQSEQDGCDHCQTMLSWYRKKGTFTLQYRCSSCGSVSQVGPKFANTHERSFS